jgi:pro-apoptotic serine protease NMA111
MLDFRLKAVTFDSVPWVITMKKNDHYFPTMEWIKDPKESCGWRRVSYEGADVFEGEATDGVPAPADDTEME